MMSSRTSDLYRERMNSKMTPDELVRMIFRIQEERDPSADPGDMTIMIQDDMPLVMITQHNSTFKLEPGENETAGEWLTRVQGTPGDSIQDALEKHLEAVREGKQ
jgi:hypothetical protein